jgi:NAD(P)-dependent dehydrogenase (short-subunit alcohol dehydrogenase family)
MSDELLGLRGRNALVVGGGLGIGRATCEQLAGAGMNVAVLDREPDRAAHVAAAIAALGVTSLPIAADVLESGAAEDAVSGAASALHGLDLLVNVVGLAVRSPLLEMTEEEFDLDLSRNLRYQFRFGRAFATQRGSSDAGRAIVNVASIGGLAASPGLAAYGAAKAALISLTKTMAVEWAGRGIRVNGIAPGSIVTDRFQGTPELNAMRAQAIPMGRLGAQAEIAKAVLFLASDLASYVTGHILVVDGGVTSMSALPRPREGQDGQPRLGA